MSARGVGLGKVILLGEHAVVYGAHALVASLPIEVLVEAEVVATPGLVLVDASGQRLAHAGDGSDQGRALERLGGGVPGLPAGVVLRVSSELPSGCGLGSSAAWAVASARALAELTGRSLAGDSLRTVANAAESVFHANASGVDVAAASQAGVLLFRRGDPPRALAVPHTPPLVVARVEGAPPTRQMVDAVARLFSFDPIGVGAAVSAIDALAREGAERVERADWSGLGSLLDLNQTWLERLGVSTPGLALAIAAARDAGATGAKLTGGGGGGCLVAVAPECTGQVAEALASLGCRIVLGAEG